MVAYTIRGSGAEKWPFSYLRSISFHFFYESSGVFFGGAYITIKWDLTLHIFEQACSWIFYIQFLLLKHKNKVNQSMNIV